MRLDPNSLAPMGANGAQQGRTAGPTAGPTATLVDQLSQDFGSMIDEVNRLSLEADDKIEEFATSKHKDIHGTMIAMEKASLSLRLMLQVRAKLTNAFQEIMRTPL